MADEPFSPTEFGASFKTFLDQVNSQSGVEAFFPARLREHFAVDPSQLPVVSERIQPADHPNLQLALDAYCAAPGRSVEMLGIAGDNELVGLRLSQLAVPGAGFMGSAPPARGPLAYTNVTLEAGRVLPCLQCGIVLVSDGERRVAMLVRGPSATDYRDRITLEVMAPNRELADEVLAQVRQQMRARNVYSRKVVSLSTNSMGVLRVDFHRLREVDRSDIVLPSGVLERIERHACAFARHKETLLASGRHLKRGLLLHGAPGTGKTLTAMFLAAQMTDRTKLILTGRTLGLIEESCRMARMLEPSMVILEDVDLVAEARDRPGQACAPLLFELLNEMDGLADDADILFVLTTNRPDLLEPALASRPGRIDLAVEIPLPDPLCRGRLLELFGRGLDLSAASLERIVDRTEGTSAAFLRELVRKAALIAADDGCSTTVGDAHLQEALHELAVTGGRLTRSLLGFASRRPPALGQHEASRDESGDD